MAKENDFKTFDCNEKKIVSVLPEYLLEETSCDLIVLRLPHPRTKESRLFLMPEKKADTIFEANCISDDCRSWFINETVEENGKLVIATEMDLGLLVLPYIMESNKISPLEHILMDVGFPDLMKLNLDSIAARLATFCDQKGDQSLNAFKYNEEKTIEFLKKKAKKLAQHLRKENINVSHGSKSSNYISNETGTTSEEAHLRYALGIISEYIIPELSEKLHSTLGVTPDEPPPREEVNDDFEPNSKRIKVEPTDDYSSALTNSNGKVKTPTAKEKSLATAAKGSKSITSFFKKK